MKTFIFGNENAEKDDLLYECAVNTPGGDDVNHILTGRWGTGKSARLFLLNQGLSNALRQINPSLERIWYVDEKALDIETLAKESVSQEVRSFSRALERIWKAEIIRRAIILLGHLRLYYGDIMGTHWDFVQAAQKGERITASIWSQLPRALKLLADLDNDRTNALVDMQDHFSGLFGDTALEFVQRCLRDIEGRPLQPLIAVEPIDTPTSALEQEVSLAQAIVTSLLNVFQSHFQPDSRQRLMVVLAIPWHRYSRDAVNFPQKLNQYKLYIQWHPEDLKGFINRRIEYEFKRYGRTYTMKGDKDPWTTLFGTHVKNGYCKPEIAENSFGYILRHTHHRPRELQRLARLSVEKCASKTGRSLADVIRGKGGINITDGHIREATAEYTRDTSDDVITEARRRFPKMDEAVEIIRGIKVPFTKDDLKSRLQKRKGVDLEEVIDILWQSGTLGVEVTALTEDGIAVYNDLLGHRAYMQYTNAEHSTFHKWCFFEYNYEYDVNDLLCKFNAEKDSTVQLVLHPTTFEYLCNVVSRTTPIGI